ncbi:DUF1987 domain-containing protein [Franconibacter helveticus]|uniref:DUF1987 domain-containing protein n=1 Tax=Franconibacter helveticus TaxID=357240 RepID=UPI00290D8CC7|nr:DUF1987 domain-containing protein [Franconibacter helveticus]MDU6925466.1 DUF1987 domain-containing protein [Franconibacter helveticus]
MTDTTLLSTIALAATHSTPEVNFDFAAHRLWLKGEAYPENAAAFFRPLIQAVESWLAELPVDAPPIALHVALSYFNSSSTKLLFEFFECLNSFAKRGTRCELHWYYDEEDDISEEFGQELALDFTSLVVLPRPELNAC